MAIEEYIDIFLFDRIYWDSFIICILFI